MNPTQADIQMMSTVVSSAIDAAVKLTGYIIKIRMKRNEAIEEEDVYDIYQESFARTMLSFEDAMKGHE